MIKNFYKYRILILDFGSQYTQLVARRVRELGVYCELFAWDLTELQIRAFNPSGIILSGGPKSTTEQGSPRASDYIFQADVPVLGVCYGMQTMVMQLGGKVQSSIQREFGYSQIAIMNDSLLVHDIYDSIDNTGKPVLDVWMSHGDMVTVIPEGFVTIASAETCLFAIIANEKKSSTAYNFIQRLLILVRVCVS